MTVPDPWRKSVTIVSGNASLSGDLMVPLRGVGLVLIADDSGSSRRAPRNQELAGMLHEHGFATLILDLLTPHEELVDERTAQYRFDIPLLTERVVAAIDWLSAEETTAALPLGLFGAGTGAAAALVAASLRPGSVRAIVSRGGRPDLAGEALERVVAPTLLVVGGLDTPVVTFNRDCLRQLHGDAALEVVPGATHLFEEPGALEAAARLATGWFAQWLPAKKLARA